MAGSDRRTANDGYRPITEGYQPRKPQISQRGYTPAQSGNSGQQAPKPPSGGSSASKPSANNQVRR
jgi:hypothetical protein